MLKYLKKYTKPILYLAWVQSLVSVLGSLYFSEIAHFPPCILCWYQRILMYPLALIIPVGILRKDKNLPYYVLPLSILGTLIAFYHNLVYLKIVPDTLSPCFIGVSCTTKFIEFFGFLTIPLLSLLAFLTIDVCMLLFIKINKKR